MYLAGMNMPLDDSHVDHFLEVSLLKQRHKRSGDIVYTANVGIEHCSQVVPVMRSVISIVA